MTLLNSPSFWSIWTTLESLGNVGWRVAVWCEHGGMAASELERLEQECEEGVCLSHLNVWIDLLSCCLVVQVHECPWQHMTTPQNGKEVGESYSYEFFFAQTRCKCYSLEGNWGRCVGKSIWPQVCAHDWVRSFRSLFNVQLLVLDILRQIFKHVLCYGFLQERGAAVQGPQ